MSKNDKITKKFNEMVIRTSNPYVWMVKDHTEGKSWLFYDGENAGAFMHDRRQETGNRVTYDTVYILDMVDEDTDDYARSRINDALEEASR